MDIKHCEDQAHAAGAACARKARGVIYGTRYTPDKSGLEHVAPEHVEICKAQGLTIAE